jgi:hypothetical protein
LHARRLIGNNSPDFWQIFQNLVSFG